MLHPTHRARGTRVARSLVLAMAALLVHAGAAYAAVGVQNPSFENGLEGWTAEILYEGDHGAVQVEDDCEDPQHDLKRTVCVVVGSDVFTPDGGSPVTVTPLDGTKMVRLGGPFEAEQELQARDSYRLSQTFTVDPANPVLSLNYNVFLFDDQGFDELRFTLADEHGATISEFAQNSHAALGDTSLKTTGWRSVSIDLSGYESEQVRLTIASGGTLDQELGFWAYVDAGDAPARRVSAPSFKPLTNLVTDPPVPLNTFSDPVTGQTYAAAAPADANAFPGGCMPLEVTVRIDSSEVSEAYILASFAKEFAMSEVSPGTWRGVINCAKSGELAVQYQVGEDPESTTFIAPIGGIALVDPAGVVYDQARYDAAVAGGMAPDGARAAAAIEGATVRLQREVGGSFKNVLSGDPGISPHINPEITGANGQFQWQAAAGAYRVVVSKPGYVQAVSRAAAPDVTDLHVGLVPTSAPPPPLDAAPGGGAPAVVTGPPTTTSRKPACAGLRGAKLAKCKRAQKLAKAIAACRKGKASKRALCIRRAKALSKCEAMTGRQNAAKRRRCVAKARRIGAKP